MLTKAEFIELERQYWGEGGTGFIFNLGAVVGFIVGTVIVYQILYTDVSDHLPEYATLKAMGYSDRYLTRRSSPRNSRTGRIGIYSRLCALARALSNHLCGHLAAGGNENGQVAAIVVFL